jgi:dihydrofolate reductase
MQISLVAAVDRRGLLGRAGTLPWHVPSDLARFRALTWGRPVLMGRHTWSAIGHPLAGRRNLVLSRDKGLRLEGAEVFTTWHEALRAIEGSAPELMVMGGAVVFALGLPHASRLHLSVIEGEYEGDVWFPPVDANAWTERAHETPSPDARDEAPHRYVLLERRRVGDVPSPTLAMLQGSVRVARTP